MKRSGIRGIPGMSPDSGPAGLHPGYVNETDKG
jgi:hypothetical protein